MSHMLDIDEVTEMRLMQRMYGPSLREDIELPDAVVPTLEKLKLVRAIIRRKFKLSWEDANMITAALFGFTNYYFAREAYWDRTVGYAPDDECPPDVILRRRAMQANILVRLAGAEPKSAKTVIDLVRPTMVNWEPSLRSLNPFQRRH
ncbi:hypothetical protein OIU34_23560 [Pararhizobium sp. BT-229]|uniref:hypothetical protein n=1 Tax=Pararhizobium sp. BT-229 TaxID=2986923 RepID=UPI0021F6E1C8|nr:hypothetical protein [Pararhizobium sp. BT-229]MCV9964874.1 hypothetical protein [Pararhizobium sp. BT-229]